VSSKETAAAEPKIVLNKKGKPSYVLVPWEKFRILSPQEADGLDILTDKDFSDELKSRTRSHLSKKDPVADTVPLERAVREV